MTRDPAPTSPSNPPIACTLDADAATGQLLEWRDLQRLAHAIVAIDNGARITLPVELAGQVDDLVARETGCCSFLSITTTRADDALTIEVVSEHDDAKPVIAALAGIPLS